MSNLQHHYLLETPTEARAAFSGRLVLYGLMFGILGALGVYAIVYLHFFG